MQAMVITTFNDNGPSVSRPNSPHIYVYLLNDNGTQNIGMCQVQIGLSDRPERVWSYRLIFLTYNYKRPKCRVKWRLWRCRYRQRRLLLPLPTEATVAAVTVTDRDCCCCRYRHRLLLLPLPTQATVAAVTDRGYCCCRYRQRLLLLPLPTEATVEKKTNTCRDRRRPTHH